MKNFIKMIIFFILLLECRFFYLISLPSFIDSYNTYHTKILICLICMGVFLILLIKKQYKYIKKNSIFNNSIYSLIILVCIEFILSKVNYNQKINELIWVSYFYFLIIFYFILVYYQKRYNDNIYIKNIIIIFTLILSSIFLIQAIKFNNGSELFLKISELRTNPLESRLGRVRLTYPSTIIGLGIILAFSELIKNKDKKFFKKLINLSTVILGVFYLTYVCQTRALILSVIISIIIMIVYIKKRGIFGKIIFMFLFSIVLMVILNLNITKEYINTFKDNANSISVTYRKGAMNYFIKQGMENVVFGRGLINALPNDDSFYVARGNLGTYSTTDVGIIGFWAMFGLCGLLWYMFLIYKLFKVIIYIKKVNKLTNNIELVGIYVFILATSFTLIIMDSQRIILLPIILSVFNEAYINAYYEERNNSTSTKELKRLKSIYINHNI